MGLRLRPGPGRIHRRRSHNPCHVEPAIHRDTEEICTMAAQGAVKRWPLSLRLANRSERVCRRTWRVAFTRASVKRTIYKREHSRGFKNPLPRTIKSGAGTAGRESPPKYPGNKNMTP